ncbi:MAG: hypothetical protein BWY75_03375 [bacterium ADurb.Bin425]|nr:MAG: hypothetical protein BWY75_03375 [bacterium ADurb.Bin425]
MHCINIVFKIVLSFFNFFDFFDFVYFAYLNDRIIGSFFTVEAIFLICVSFQAHT